MNNHSNQKGFTPLEKTVKFSRSFPTRRDSLTGFTMVEALVAITVLTIGVTGVLSLLAQSLVNADYAKNQITAFFLAQEGQELVIGKRNTNRLQGKIDPVNTLGNNDLGNEGDNPLYWLKEMRRCFGACYIGTADENFSKPKSFKKCVESVDSEDDSICPVLNLTPNGFYGYDGGDPTIFTREIQVTPFMVSGEEPKERGATVRVTIKWRDRPASPNRSFTLNSIIFR